MLELLRRFDGMIVQRKTAEEVAASNRTLLEYTWNHTTLCALKLDKSLTYIQSRFDPVRHVEQAKALEQALGGEVLMHLEFLRNHGRRLHLQRPAADPLHRTDERLDEIMQIHRDHGVAHQQPARLHRRRTASRPGSIRPCSR